MSKQKLNWQKFRATQHLVNDLRHVDFYCPSCDRWLPQRALSTIDLRGICKECAETERNELMTHMVTRPGPVANPADLEYDAKLVWEVFAHNKNSTLDYGWIRNKIIRTNGKLTNDRQNAALAHLESQELIEKVGHGRYRFKKPNRPSAPVVASAPATPEEAAQVIPQFRGATTDLVYSLLRERLPAGLTSAEIYSGLGIDTIKDRNNVAASLQSLDKSGWIDVDRSSGRKQIYSARVTNKLGKAPPTLRHARAPVEQPVQLAKQNLPEAPTPPTFVSEQPALLVQQVQQAPQPARSFTLQEVKRYGELHAERATLQHEIDELKRTYAARLLEIKVLDGELREKYGEG